MASNNDVFYKLNDFLSKKADESFEIEEPLDDSTAAADTANESAIDAILTMNSKVDDSIVISDDDVIICETVINYPRRRARKRRARCVDLTDDEVPEAKKMSYEEALLVRDKPIPQLTASPVANQSRPAASKEPERPRRCVLDSREKSTFVLISDDETEEENQDESEEIGDPNVIKLNVKIKEVIKTFLFRLDQRFVDLYKQLAKQEKVPITSIALYNGDSAIVPHHTPKKIGYRISSIFTCRILDPSEEEIPAFKRFLKQIAMNVKFQSDKWRRQIALTISPIEPFQVAVETLCKNPLVPFNLEQFTLCFDGDAVPLHKTPMDLEFEGDELMDILVKV